MAEIEAIFDACLFKLERGATIEESLQGHAAEQAEIAPLLQVAAALRSLAAPVPARSEKSRQATRAAFLAAAGVAREATPVSPEDALEESLALLASGATVADCVAAFPGNAAQLRPSLDIASALQTMAEPAPQRAAAQIANERAAFLASARTQARQPRKTGGLAAALVGLSALFRQPAWRAVAVVLLLLVTFFGVGGAALTLAAGALPGDALYPVKLAAEQVRVTVTRDESQRAQLLAVFEQRRRQEAVAVAGQGRQVAVQFPGTIESLLDGVWTISGMALPVFVPGDAEVSGAPAVGRQVLITGYSDGQGRLIARQVIVFGGGAAPSPTPTATFTGTPGRAIAPPAQSTATARPRPSATPVTPPTATATLTATPTISATATLTTALTATPSATPSGTPSVSPTPTGTLAPYPGSHFGLIEEIHPTWWLVNGLRIVLTPDTLIDESLGPAEIGAEVAIEGIVLSDPPAFQATLIRVMRSNVETKDWTGTIQSMSGSIWVVGNTTVDVAGADISGAPAVGKVASVHARRHVNEMWQATSVSVQEVEYVYFSGAIESISGDIWVVGGRTVDVSDAQITGDPPRVGLYAEIEAIQTGGQLLAVRVNVVGPTATPTGTPLATPTATVVATPTPTPTSVTATPTDTAAAPSATPTEAPPTATATEPPPATDTPVVPSATPTEGLATPTATATQPSPTATTTPVPTLPFTPPPPPTLEAPPG